MAYVDRRQLRRMIMNEIRRVTENQEERFQGDSLLIITLKGGTFDDVKAKLSTDRMAPLVQGRTKDKHGVFLALNKLASDSRESGVFKFDRINTALRTAGIYKITPVTKTPYYGKKSHVMSPRDTDASSGIQQAMNNPNQHVVRIESKEKGPQHNIGAAESLTDENMAALQVELEDRLDLLGLDNISVDCSVVDLS